MGNICNLPSPPNLASPPTHFSTRRLQAPQQNFLGLAVDVCYLPLDDGALAAPMLQVCGDHWGVGLPNCSTFTWLSAVHHALQAAGCRSHHLLLTTFLADCAVAGCCCCRIWQRFCRRRQQQRVDGCSRCPTAPLPSSYQRCMGRGTERCST